MAGRPGLLACPFAWLTFFHFPLKHLYARRATINSSLVLSASTVTFPPATDTTRSPLPAFFSASSSIPRNSSPAQHRSRNRAEFSPIPPVNATASIPPIAAAYPPVAAGHPRKPRQPSLLRQLPPHLFRAPSVTIHHVQHREHVQIAVPRGVLQPRLRREPHRRVHTPPARDRAHRRTPAQMAAHQLHLAPQHRRHALPDVLMRGAVESVLLHPILPPPARYPVAPRVLRHRRVELRLERRHNRHSRHRLP